MLTKASHDYLPNVSLWNRQLVACQTANVGPVMVADPKNVADTCERWLWNQREAVWVLFWQYVCYVLTIGGNVLVRSW